MTHVRRQYVMDNLWKATMSKPDLSGPIKALYLSSVVLLSSQSLHTCSDLTQSFPHQKSPFWTDTSFPLSLVRALISARISTRHLTAFSSS